MCVVAHGGVNARMDRKRGVELVGKGLQLRALLSHMGRQRRGGSGKGELRAQVLRAGTSSGFLSAAKDSGAQRRAVLKVERTGCHRAADLMRGNGHGIDAQLGDIERNMQIALDGIGVEQGAHGMRGGGQLADGLHHTGLVVGCHDAHECDVVAEQVIQRSGLDVARTAGLHQIDGKTGGAQQRQVVKDRIVLNRRHDDAVALAIALTSALGKSEERQLVCLGAAVGQDDLGRADACAKATGDLATGNFQACGGLASKRVQRIGVDAGKLAVVIFALRKERLGAHGRRGGVVKIHGYAVLTCGHKGLCLLCGLIA